MRKRQKKAKKSPIHSRTIHEFDTTHFPTASLARQFHSKFMSWQVTSSYYIDIDSFDELYICGKSVRRLLKIVGWENALSIEENV